MRWFEPSDLRTFRDNYLTVTSFASRKTFKDLSFVTAHNANAQAGYNAANNQSHNMYDQMKDHGVRGLMIDIAYRGGELRLVHSDFDFGNFQKRMAGEVGKFMNEHPNEVLVFDIQANGVTIAQLTAGLDSVPEIKSLLFNPWSSVWNGHSDWPTHEELAANNQRIIMMIDNNDLAKQSATDGLPSVLFRNDINVENMYGETGGNQCTQRHQYGNRKTGMAGRDWSRLFTMNHFGSAADDPLDARRENNWDHLYPRMVDTCIPSAGVTDKPNLIAVDFVGKGDALEIVEVLNQGGLILYEGNNATQNIVCGIPAGAHASFDRDSERTYGCENDEARSGRLVGVRAGTTFALYDSPVGRRPSAVGRRPSAVGRLEDDFVHILVKKNIGTVGKIIHSFELDYETDFVKVRYAENNGLDGKVSRFEVSPPNGPKLNAGRSMVTFYEGNNGTQALLCGLIFDDGWLDHTFRTDVHYCDDDRASSAILRNVEAGRLIHVYNYPVDTGQQVEDWAVITVKRDIDYYTVNSFMDHVDNQYVRVDHHSVAGGLNGRVSRVRMHPTAGIADVVRAPIFSEDFNAYRSWTTGTQCLTSAMVGFGGIVPNWYANGHNATHAMTSPSGDTAPTFFNTNQLTMSTGVAANEPGTDYVVSFDASPAVWAACEQASNGDESIRIEVLRPNGSVLQWYDHEPQHWSPDGPVFIRDSFSYTGDGTGEVRLRISDISTVRVNEFETVEIRV